MLAMEKEKRQARELISKIYEKDYQKLVNYAYCTLYGAGKGDRGRAEDVVQEASIIVLRSKFQDFCQADNPTGWLINTIRNVARNTRGHDMHIAKCLQEAQQYCDGISTDVYSLDVIFEGIVEPSELAILQKVYLDGYQYRDMEAELGVAPSAFAMRLKRIKAKFIKNYFLVSEKTSTTTHNKTGGLKRGKS